MGSPAPTEFSPTAWSLVPSPLLRLTLRLTQRLIPGCTTTVSATLLIPMAMGTTDMGWAMLVWATMAMAIIWVMDTTATTSATTARGRPRPNQLPRLMLMLPQRRIPGCTIAMLVTGSTHTDMATTGMGWAMLPMLDITPTLTTEAAEMAMEPWFPAPANSLDVSALVLMK